jgi:hypothetical protein
VSDAPLSDKFYADPAAMTATQCVYCKHAATGFLPVCAAFPGWIPEQIQLNRADHRKPYDGDQGIRFEPRPEVPAQVLANLYAELDRLHPEL